MNTPSDPSTEPASGSSTPVASTPPEWLDTLTEKLALDDDFRRMFERTPGKASNSIGIPYEDFKALLAASRNPADAALAERSSALHMTSYGTLMTKIRGALGSADQCACNYTPGRWADYCAD